jgi:hypothetical protein
MQATEDSIPRETVSIHHQVLARLEDAMASMSERFAAAREKLEQEFDERRQKQEQVSAERLAQLEEAEAKLRAQIEADREALQERERQLDDRDNTHVRRELRDQFKKHLASFKTAFELTKGTRRLRLPIHLATWFSIVLLATGIWFFAVQAVQPSDGWAYLAYIAKPVGLTIAAIGLITCYLRCMTRWSDRHADAEFQLKQLELDMDRASWVVETAFEWKSREEQPIPNHLLESVSRNLFARADQHEETSAHPVDQLASALLGQASHAKLNIGGHEIEFGRRALKKAGKDE